VGLQGHDFLPSRRGSLQKRVRRGFFREACDTLVLAQASPRPCACTGTLSPFYLPSRWGSVQMGMQKRPSPLCPHGRTPEARTTRSRARAYTDEPAYSTLARPCSHTQPLAHVLVLARSRVRRRRPYARAPHPRARAHEGRPSYSSLARSCSRPS
jgi:hypothetical protein